MTSKLQQLAVELERELNSRINEELILPQLETLLTNRGHMLPEQAGNSVHVRDAIYNVVDMVDHLRTDNHGLQKDRDYWRTRYHEEVYGPEPEQLEDQPEEQAVEAFDEPPAPEPVEAPFFRVDAENANIVAGAGDAFTGDALADLLHAEQRIRRAQMEQQEWRNAVWAINTTTQT